MIHKAPVIYRNPRLDVFVQVCVQLPQDERDQYEAFTGVPYDPYEVAARYSLQGGPAWFLDIGGEPIVVGGFVMIRDGVWQDWLFSTPAAWETHWRTVSKVCRRTMDAMLQESAHRLQCVSLASRIHAHRWYRVLGLELEGTLRGYGANGEDALMFSRLRTPNGHE